MTARAGTKRKSSVDTHHAAAKRPIPIDERLLRAWPLPELPPNADKQARGDVLVVGGSSEVPGAILLAGTAALRAGAGRLQLGVVQAAAIALAIAVPEARVIALPQTRKGELGRGALRSLSNSIPKSRALLIGPGMTDASATEPLLRAALEQEDGPTIVLDAAALRVLERGQKLGSRESWRRVIATPHAGEMARLWGCSREHVEGNKEKLAREAARELGVTLLLKGTTTIITTPDDAAFRSTNGNSGLATSGSGDVLAGLIAGLCARGATPVQASAWGVHLHGAAGDALARQQGPLGYLARELSAEVPALLAKLDAKRRSAR